MQKEIRRHTQRNKKARVVGNWSLSRWQATNVFLRQLPADRHTRLPHDVALLRCKWSS